MDNQSPKPLTMFIVLVVVLSCVLGIFWWFANFPDAMLEHSPLLEEVK